MDQQTQQPAWVWISSDESIAKGQVSILALLEIPCAMALFGWLSSISPRPWLTLIEHGGEWTVSTCCHLWLKTGACGWLWCIVIGP